MKKFYPIFFLFTLIFVAHVIGAEKAQNKQEKLCKNVNRKLQNLVDWALTADYIHAGAALHHFAQSVNDENYSIESYASSYLLGHYGLLGNNKVKKEIRDAFRAYGQSQLSFLGTFVGYEAVSKKFERSDD